MKELLNWLGEGGWVIIPAIIVVIVLMIICKGGGSDGGSPCNLTGSSGCM